MLVGAVRAPPLARNDDVRHDTAYLAGYVPISSALVRVLANMITRELAHPDSASSRQTALSSASTSALRLPDVYGAN
jgi:hypothetical protein